MSDEKPTKLNLDFPAELNSGLNVLWVIRTREASFLKDD